MEWGDVQDMLTEEVMTESALKGAWKEASKGAYHIIAVFMILTVNLMNSKDNDYNHN
jgi:hypothetical protein